TTNGNTPTSTSTLYSTPIVINNNVTIRAIAMKSNMYSSAVISFSYTIKPLPKAAEPTASPPSGTVLDAGSTVELFCATDGASIRYTTNGNTPTSTSALYSTPIVINNNVTIKAIAMKDGMTSSAEISFTYTIKPLPKAATPTATPVSGTLLQVGDFVTLDCEIEDATIYYTTNGTNPTTSSPVYTDPILIDTLSTTITIRAIAAKSGMTTSDIMTATYPISQPLSISLGGVTGKLMPGTTNILIENYADPANIAAFTIPNGAFRDAIAGKDITVNIQGAAENTVSLAYVHHLRRALQSAVGAGRNVSIDSALTPEFNGREWWSYWSGGETHNLYKDYSNPETILMVGITVYRESNNKYMIVYSRDLKVSQLVWQNNSIGFEAPFRGFGLKKDVESGGTFMPFISGDGVVFAGHSSEETNPNQFPVVSDWRAYDSALKEAGLHPSQKDAASNPIRLDHRRVRVDGITGSTNIMSNGIYDFALGYYNPTPTGTVPADFRELMPNWRPSLTSQLTFDGYAKNSTGAYVMSNGQYTPALPEGVTSRNIGGVIRTSPDRKAVSDGNGYRKDEPREDFIGSVTYTMAKYMDEKLGITAFHNTNIIGDWSIWNGLRQYNNVALIGDYSSQYSISMNSQGVIDIKGPLPKLIMNDGTNARYLNIWDNVSRETNIFDFPVAVIKGSGGEFITTGFDLAPTAVARVIIYHNKYNSMPLANGGLQPHHRAFVVNGTPKVTGGSIPITNTGWYQGTRPANPVPNLDERAWIDFANNGGTAPENLAANYEGLAAEFRMTQAEWEGF
ncbi:MAG: chitobiase/beta-hexosaminidase C-terminal domain-containing protein, partial [Peptococcaceae bacterium]|nr:chitobiase/beta-hexosaminidase C-terminal domain-containing protein [Peptococcaceae bacterium]